MHAGELPVNQSRVVDTNPLTVTHQAPEITLEESILEDNHQSNISDIIIDVVFNEIGKQADKDQISNFLKCQSD